MEKSWVYGCLLLAIAGCAITPVSEEVNAEVMSVTGGCPAVAPKLSGDRMSEVSIQYRKVSDSGNVSHDESVGYQFQGKTGQKLTYGTSSRLCHWLFAPGNQPVTIDTFPVELPMDGKYLLQISAEGSSTAFQVEMAIEPFERSSFPRNICGDSKPTDPTAYPVSFYPVNVPYSSSNLQKAKSMFCADAYKKYRAESGDYSIQLSSFTNLDKAKAFAKLVNAEISGAKVGDPTIVKNP